jgi:hypothetical protein
MIKGEGLYMYNMHNIEEEQLSINIAKPGRGASYYLNKCHILY